MCAHLSTKCQETKTGRHIDASCRCDNNKEARTDRDTQRQRIDERERERERERETHRQRLREREKEREGERERERTRHTHERGDFVGGDRHTGQALSRAPE